MLSTSSTKLLVCLLAAGLLTACPPANSPAPNQPNTQSPDVTAPNPAAPEPSDPGSPPSAVENEGNPGTSPEAPASAAPSDTVNNDDGAFTLPENLASIRFGQINRFLRSKGASTRFSVQLLDQNGEIIPVDLPLEWSSSRPQQFAVDEQGNIQALVGYGYATIRAQIPGTDLSTEAVINVSTPGGGGGGGGGSAGGGGAPANAAPVITRLTASSNNVVGAGILVRLNAAASDAETQLANANYVWSCSANCTPQFISTQGTEVFWRSPAAAGAYTLKLTVSDGSASSSQNLVVNVQAGQGQLQINP